MEGLMPWHQHLLVNIEYDRVDLVKEGANSQAFIKLIKSKGGNTMPFEEVLKLLKTEHQEVVTKHIKAILDAAAVDVQKAKDDAQVAIEKAKSDGVAPPAGTSEEEILKTIKDPAVRSLMETQIAKTRAAEEEVRKARDERLEQEAIAKAKEVPNIGAEEAQLKDVYKQLKNTDPVLCETVFGIFKAASAVTRDGAVFTEIGKGAGNSTGSLSEEAAWSKIEQAADTIAKERNITKAAATKEAISANPALYDAYLKAQLG